jgi:hypothetical protein
LNISPNEDDECADFGCVKSYTDYIHVINPRTGHCLTTQNYLAPRSKLVFQACDPAPTNFSQLFQASQVVNYDHGFHHITSYSEVDLDPIQLSYDTDPFQAWILAKDNKTIEVELYQYTQHGYFATLIKP